MRQKLEIGHLYKRFDNRELGSYFRIMGAKTELGSSKNAFLRIGSVLNQP